MNRAGLVARLLRRPCPVCELHRHHRDPYYRARPACPEWFHRATLGWSAIATIRPTTHEDTAVRPASPDDDTKAARRDSER